MSLRRLRQLLIGLTFFSCASVYATPFSFDVSGVQSDGVQFSVNNALFAFNVGANAHVSFLTYSVGLTAYAPSRLSEMRVSMTDAAYTTGIVLTPGATDLFSGTGAYADQVDLGQLDLAFTVGADGILRVEFYESVDNLIGADGQWDFGTITLDVTQPGEADVPEPATTLLMGAGLPLLAYGRRRAAALSKNIT